MWPRGRVDGQRAEYRRLGAGRRLLDRWVAPREGKARAQTICQGRWPAAREVPSRPQYSAQGDQFSTQR